MEKMEKSYIVLKMYDDFCAGTPLRLKECCKIYEISLPTFRRYIAFLRYYFSVTRNSDIIYDRADDVYRLA